MDLNDYNPSGAEFPNGFASPFLNAENSPSENFREMSNTIADNSPFGQDSAFYTANYIEENIDFIKLIAFINTRQDAEFDYKNFIGTATRQLRPYIIPGPIYYIPVDTNSGGKKETYQTEVPLKDKSLLQRNLLLKGRLNTYKAVVNVHKDSENDNTNGAEFEFDLDGKSLEYKLHYYYSGKARVYERDNKNNIAFSITSSNYDDYVEMLRQCGLQPSDRFLSIVRERFLKELKAVEAIASLNNYDLPDPNKLDWLNWLYENMPSFIAKDFDVPHVIKNIFELRGHDNQNIFGDDTEQGIINIISRLKPKAVYDYFRNNPQDLIDIYNDIESGYQELFCQCISAITFVVEGNNVETKLREARKFSIGGPNHIESNIASGDEEGKVGLTNEFDSFSLGMATLPLNMASLITFFYKDVEINNPENKSNQFHPLDIIYIERYDPDTEQTEYIPTIALYGKYLGDKSEWDDIKLATTVVLNIVGIILSGGTLAAGAVGIARLFAIVDITISTIDLLTLTPGIQKLLKDSEGGKWFLSHWHMISFCVNLGTISYYLAKGIVKYRGQISQHLKGNSQLAENFKKLANESSEIVQITKYGKSFLDKAAVTYAKIYPKGRLYKLLNLNQAYNLYKNPGKNLVREVNNAFEKIVRESKSVSDVKKKVMVSGMAYKAGKNTRVFTAANFTREEIPLGKVTRFIESMHPLLKKRYELHLEEISKGLKATPDLIEKAGVAASHGEVRALNDLLYHLEKTGVALTDDIFTDIMAYNRYLVKEGSQPPCVHCFYLTDGVEYLKNLK